MRRNLSLRQRSVVDGNLIDRSGKIRAGWLIRPTRHVVSTHAPVPVVALSRGDRRVVANTFTINVQLHTVRAKISDDVVVVAVVVALRTGHGLDRTWIHAEDELAVVAHVNMAVIVAAVARGIVAEADDLSTLCRGGLDPGFRGVRVASRNGRACAYV